MQSYCKRLLSIRSNKFLRINQGFYPKKLSALAFLANSKNSSFYVIFQAFKTLPQYDPNQFATKYSKLNDPTLFN